MKASPLKEIEKRVAKLTEKEQLLLLERLARKLRQNRDEADWEDRLKVMAADADIRRELRAIDKEFRCTESDGLEGL